MTGRDNSLLRNAVLRRRVLSAAKLGLPWLGLGLLGLSLCFLLLTNAPPPAPLAQMEPEPGIPSPLPPLFTSVVIDPGHGGIDNGGAAHGLQEKNLTLDLAQQIATELGTAGLTTVLTRTGDNYVSLLQRVELADQVSNAIFVSIHCNLSTDPAAHGFEIYRSSLKSAPLAAAATQQNVGEVEDELSQCVAEALVSMTNLTDHGRKTAGFYVVRNVPYPAILIECGFLSNAPEARRLGNPAYRQTIAHAICRGIMDYRSLASGRSVKSVWQNKTAKVMVGR